MSTSGYIDQTAAQWAFYNYNTWLRGGIASPYNAEKLPITNKDVDAIRPEVDQAMPKYTMIRDCLLGQENIKMKGELYLPRPNEDIEIAEDVRYRAYVKRSVFLNATGHTQRAIVGKLFAKKPTIELPETLMGLMKDANGDGLPLDQLVEKCVAETFAFGRCGLYADFRAVGAEVMSIADAEMLSPTLTFVRAEDIINWQIDRFSKKTTLVVVREDYEDREGFAVRIKSQYRVFRLVNNVLQVQVQQPKRPSEDMLAAAPTDTRFEVVEEYTPMLPGGKPWDIIPFVIIGSTNNDWAIDEPPLYPISVYDIALYRNSADIEESAFLMGQPTLVVSGVSPEMAESMEGFKLGSGRVLSLEEGASATLLQAAPATLINTLIEEKHKILRNLGAVFIEDKPGLDQTATGAVYQALQTHAPLITTSRNAVMGTKKAVGYAAMFLGVDPNSEEIEVKLNADIIDNPLGVTGLQTAAQLYRDGGLTWDEYREQLRVQGLTLYTPDEAQELIEKEGLGSFPAEPDPDAPVIDDDAMDMEVDDATAEGS